MPLTVTIARLRATGCTRMSVPFLDWVGVLVPCRSRGFKINEAKGRIAPYKIVKLRGSPRIGANAQQGLVVLSFRGALRTRTRNLEIHRCAIAHLRSGPSDHP